MIPETMPVFNADDIIEPPAKEFEEGDKKTATEWLRYLFLYYICSDNEDCVQIRPEDEKDCKKALDILRAECKIGPKDWDLLEWEDRATRKQQAAVLNIVRKKLGYVVEYYK